MDLIEIDGVRIAHELLGPADGPPVVLTPGGRFSGQVAGLPQLAAKLAEAGLRVLIWDRPNCGASDLHFEGPSESAMQAGFLVRLVDTLGLGAVTLVGGSAGARVSLLAAAQAPHVVAGLMLCWISGGLVSMMRLGSYYCCEPAEEAALKGMEAVAAMPIWAQQLAANPRNREVLLGFEPAEFIARMERWAAGYIPSPDTPVGGISREAFATLAMPARVLRGSPRDLYHPARVCEEVAALMPAARLVDPPWDIDVFARRMVDGSGLFSDWPLLAADVIEFVGEVRA